MRKPTSAQSRNRFLPGLEALEDRCVPSALHGHGKHVVFHAKRGTAIQNGASLTISATSVTRIGIKTILGNNTVQVKDNGAGIIQVNWNGGLTHTFAGIDDVTINVKGQTDNVNYTFTGPLTRLPNSGAQGLPGSELISVNLNGVNETFNFSGDGLQNNAALDIGVQAISSGSHSIEMVDRGDVGTQATLIMRAQGLGSNNFINVVAGNIGAGSVAELTAVGSGNGPGSANVETAVEGDIGANANVSMRADAGPSATKVVNTLEGQVGQGATVTMDGQGSKAGNDTINNFVTMNTGSQGNVTATEEGFGNNDTFTLQKVGSTTGATDFVVSGFEGTENTANVSPGVQVINCQVINHLP